MYLIKKQYTQKYDMYTLYGDDSIMITQETNESKIRKLIAFMHDNHIMNYTGLSMKIKAQTDRPNTPQVNTPITEKEYNTLNKFIIDVW